MNKLKVMFDYFCNKVQWVLNHAKKGIVIGLAAFVMAGALVYYNFIDKAPTQSTDNFAIETYANTDGTFALDGNTVTLADQEGKVCVLNFWETWCQACVEELPEFNEVQEEYGDQVQIYAIAGVTSSKSEIQEIGRASCRERVLIPV